MIRSIEGCGDNLKIPILIECDSMDDIETAARKFLQHLTVLKRDNKYYLTPEINKIKYKELAQKGFTVV